MVRILILTVTAGNGHNACANAMKEKLESSGEAEVKVVDLLKKYSTKLNVWVADKGYSLAVSRLPRLYDAFYNKYMHADPKNRFSCPSQSTIMSTLNGLLKEILEFKPDVIYSTHFYGSIAVTDLKLFFDLPCKCITANLDYVNSPFWEAGVGVDYFVIPNEDFTEEFVAEGYSRRQLLPWGLPVNGKTLETTDKKQSREKLGLDKDVFTVLVMFGGGFWSGGYKIFKNLLKSLEGKTAQVIVINGKDKKSFKKIAQHKPVDGIKVLNVGFTNEVPLYISAADVTICKCGGTGATEIINKGVPMLISEHIPAQEKYNIKYLTEKGVALSFGNEKQLKTEILKLMQSGLLEEMSANTLPLKKDALGDIAKLILSQPQADYTAFTEECAKSDFTKKTIKKTLKRADKLTKTNKGIYPFR